MLLGYTGRDTRLVKSITVRRSAYVILVRSNLGYVTQVWTPQSIDLIQKPERVQRRATKYILDLRTIHLRPDKKEQAAYHPSPIGTGF